MITEHFNSRTVANMEVALEQAIRLLKKESEQQGAATDWIVTPGNFSPLRGRIESRRKSRRRSRPSTQRRLRPGSRSEPSSGLRQTGGRTLVVSRTTASDFSGSAIVLVSIALHLGHSKVRCSDPSGSGAMRASIIRARHRPQRGRSIQESGTCGSLGMILLSCISRRLA